MKTVHCLLLAALAFPIAVNAQTQMTDTRIGKLEFDHGLPTEKTVAALYDEMDFQRACQAYLWALPIVNIGEWQRAHEMDFGAADGDIVIYTTYRAKLGVKFQVHEIGGHPHFNPGIICVHLRSLAD
jgi:hypothetical protein